MKLVSWKKDAYTKAIKAVLASPVSMKFITLRADNPLVQEHLQQLLQDVEQAELIRDDEEG